MNTISAGTLREIIKDNMTSVICYLIKLTFVIKKSIAPNFNPANDPTFTDKYGAYYTSTPGQWIITFRYINDTVSRQINELYYDDNFNLVTTPNKYTYAALPFDVALPSFEEDQIPTVNLSIFNIGYDTIATLRLIDEFPTVNLSLVAVRNNQVFYEIGPLDLTVTGVNWDESLITFTLSFDYLYLSEPFMVYKFTPEFFPGLFSWR